MATHVDDVVHTAGDPNVAVGVSPCAVAAEVVAFARREVGRLVALLVAVHCAHHSGPRALDAEQPLGLSLELLALGAHQRHLHAKEGVARGARELRPHARQRGDHVPARLGLPPRVHHGAALFAHHLEVPAPRLRVDGLAHRAQHAQRGALGARHEGVALAHQRADGRGRRVKGRHLVLVHHVPTAARVREAGYALEDNLRGAIEHGAVGDVRVARDPAAVCRAPKHALLLLLRVPVEDVLERGGREDHVATGGVQHALGLAR
mmetsp:Transcript_18634/g.57868  ORF Transcript_18634/g.57868 Transcript_18634/m.57868 type:complete len:263 (-) Transcript_18634:973-1761(-)